jgi:hypothetical protein
MKMIAYRAETALASSIAPYMTQPDVARSLIRQILMTEADIKPDYKHNTLHVSLHNLASPKHLGIAKKLCDLLNQTKTVLPETNLTVFYNMVSDHFPRDQEF